MSKVLITGDGGFVGHYLREELKDDQIFSYDLRNKQDLRNFEQLRNVLDKWRPEYIYHLAAQAYVPESFANPKRTFEVNLIGSLNLLEAVRQLGLKTKILLAGTSEEYGDGNVTEKSMLQPKSPYAISKVAMDRLGILYAQSYGMNVVVTRAFNHTGPGRGEMYADSSFAKQVAEYDKGKRQYIEHGNLESIRNYSDVRDIVKAYRLAIDLPSDVYNICSDQSVKMQYILDILCSMSKDGAVPLQVNPSLYRPADFSFKEPSCDKFVKLTSWEPEISLDVTLKDLLEYWKERV